MKRFVLSLAMLLALTASVALAMDGAAVYAKCAGCHGADGSKLASASGKDMLKGQSEADIKAKLMGYGDGSYGGKKAKLMEKIVGKLSEDEISAVSAHIATF